MSEAELDIDKEIKKISRKTDIAVMRSEYAFENQIKKLDSEIDKIIGQKIKEFDKNKNLTSDYLSIDYSNQTIDRYREKLKKI